MLERRRREPTIETDQRLKDVDIEWGIIHARGSIDICDAEAHCLCHPSLIMTEIAGVAAMQEQKQSNDAISSSAQQEGIPVTTVFWPSAGLLCCVAVRLSD